MREARDAGVGILPLRGRAFGRIVAGTDGSETATNAVRQAIELAQQLGATLTVVSAYEPAPASRLPRERRQVPPGLAHMTVGREDVEVALSQAAKVAEEQGVEIGPSPVKVIPPTRSSM